MKIIDKSEQHVDNLVKRAEDNIDSKKRGSTSEMNQAILEGVSSEVKQAVSISGDPVKAFEFRKKNPIVCCICGITAGTFFINEGLNYCSSHKNFMYMSKTEKERELVKC